MSPGARFREGAVAKAPFYAHGDIARVSDGESNVFMVEYLRLFHDHPRSHTAIETESNKETGLIKLVTRLNLVENT